MKAIRTNALQILTENWKSDGSEHFLSDYVIANETSDPNFFRWLFDEDFANDFDADLSSEQKQEYELFISQIKSSENL